VATSTIPSRGVLTGIDKCADHLLLNCRLAGGPGSAWRLAPPVVRVATALPASTTSFSDGDDLVVVCPTSERDAVVTTIQRALRDTDFVVGMAGPCKGGLTELRSTWTSARRTAVGLVGLGMKGAVAHAAELGPLSLVLSAAQDAHTLDHAHAALSPLDQVPDRRARDIRLTMLTFLRQSQNMQRTAEELNVHVNTLYQRLAAVDDLFGQDWCTAGRSLNLRWLWR
jgi:sugar diacid utilization regulator